MYFCILFILVNDIMKKTLLTFICFMLILTGFGQTKPMKFMGVGMNSTLSTFVSKLKGKGFTEDVNHNKPNLVVMKGVFAGERVKLEVRSAAKTHLIYNVSVFFNMSTQFTYEDLQQRLTEKYGEPALELNKIKDEPVFVKYSTDYTQWKLDMDTTTNTFNAIVLSKCSYHSTSPLIITYLDGKNSKVEALEVNSDF